MQQQEDFEMMLEDYMDEDIIDEIIKQDELEEDRQQKKGGRPTETKFPMAITISINDYVTCYLGLQSIPAIEEVEHHVYRRGKKIKLQSTQKVNHTTLWHHGLKDIGSPLVFGVANDYANKNPDKVYGGELLLVIDAKGNRGTYVNPVFLRQLIESEDIEQELKKLRRTGIHQLDELEEYIRTCAQLQLKYESTKVQTEKTLEVLHETHKMHKYKQLKKELKKNDKF